MSSGVVQHLTMMHGPKTRHEPLGLRRTLTLEDLYDTLPPAGAKLVLLEGAARVSVDDLTPESLSCRVQRHLTDFPSARQGRKRRPGEKISNTAPTILLEYEELIHPVAFDSETRTD